MPMPDNYIERNFKWFGVKVPCPNNDLRDENYNFYVECILDDIKYEVGFGAVVKVDLDRESRIGVIHYFYENPRTPFASKRYVAAVEFFYRLKEIEPFLEKPVKIDNDLEVIKKNTFIINHVPVFAIKSRCVIVYGLHDEDPQDLLHEFLATTSDTIYVCRYIATAKNGSYVLKSAIAEDDDESITEIEDDSPNKSQTAGKFAIAHVENIASNIKIKLKRELSPPIEFPTTSTEIQHGPLILSRNKKESPSELLKNLTLSCEKQVSAQEEVQTMNQNKKHRRKSPLASIDVPTVILDKIDLTEDLTTPEATKRNVIQFKPSLRVRTHTNTETPTRISTRNVPRVSYQELSGTGPRTPKNTEKRPRGRPRKYTPSPKDKNNDEETKDSEVKTPKKRVGRPKKVEESNINKLQNLMEEVEICSPEKPKRELKKNRILRGYDFPVKLRRNTDDIDKSSISLKDTTNKRKHGPLEESPKKYKFEANSRVVNTPRSGRLNTTAETPKVGERQKPIVFCNTPMSRARMGLSAYTVPTKMPCRETEYFNVYNFVTGRILDDVSGCMYISGVPGTGKTMTVCRVMSDLSEGKKENSTFVFLHLNALNLTEPRQIYVEIVKQLLNKKLHWEQALKEIEEFFKSKKKKVPHVILVDEMDKLCNRKQDVVYNLLDLPFHSVTPLIVIAIANTMDLPERVLPNKVNSRLGLVRLTFKPYQYKEIVKIVEERLASESVFKNEALELVARKVAAVSGDARRALSMCARATEIAEEKNKDMVTMEIIDRVLIEMSSSSKVQAIQSCSKLEQLVLAAIANEVSRTGNEEVPFLNIMHSLENMCLLESFKLPAPETCLRACHNLGSFRLLLTQHGRLDINMTLMLNTSTDDIHYALRK